MKLPQRLTDLSQDAIVEMYQLDTSTTHYQDGTPIINGETFCWTPGTIDGDPVKFNGVTYIPFPIVGENYEWNGQGKAPQPTLSVMNLGGIVAGLTIKLDDLVGAVVTRIRTYKKHLDGQSEADPETYFEPDIFSIDRKQTEDKSKIIFELATPFSQMGKSIPATVIMRNTCGFVYRQFINGAWVYGTCPYTGDAMYDGTDTSVSDPSKDVCSHRMSGCIKRYGSRAKLPIYCFPGVGLSS